MSLIEDIWEAKRTLESLVINVYETIEITPNPEDLSLEKKMDFGFPTKGGNFARTGFVDFSTKEPSETMVLFLATKISEGTSLFAYKPNPKPELIWTMPLEKDWIGSEFVSKKNVAVGYNRIYAITQHLKSWLNILDFKGNHLERVQLDYVAARYSHPMVYGHDSLLLSSQKNMYCYDRDGKLKWETEHPAAFSYPPTIGKDGIYYVSDRGTVSAAYNLDGTKKWIVQHRDGEMPFITAYSKSSPILFNDMAIYGLWKGVVALDRKTGQQRWKFNVNSNSDHDSTVPALYDNKIFYRFWSVSDERLICLDARDGRKLWETGVRDNNDKPPVIDQGRIFLPQARSVAGYNLTERGINSKFNLNIDVHNNYINGLAVLEDFLAVGIDCIKTIFVDVSKANGECKLTELGEGNYSILEQGNATNPIIIRYDKELVK